MIWAVERSREDLRKCESQLEGSTDPGADELRAWVATTLESNDILLQSYQEMLAIILDQLALVEVSPVLH
jgi:hypothetical protein